MTIAGCAETPPHPELKAGTWQVQEAILTQLPGTIERQVVNGVDVESHPGDRPSELSTVYRVTFDRDASISNWGGDLLATANGTSGNVYTYKETVTPELVNLNGVSTGVYFDITTNFYSLMAADTSQWQWALNGKYAGSGQLANTPQTKIAHPGTKEGWTHTYRIVVIGWDALAKNGPDGTIGIDLKLVADTTHTYEFHWAYQYHISTVTLPAGALTTAVQIPEQEELSLNGRAFSCEPVISSAADFSVGLVMTHRCIEQTMFYNVVTGKME
ncbi:MAG TPA: hypothetical protein VFU49_00925 [Ktedonobacteraceae bacterium]|nr:hypothetical protein [Ktedonobacteraceae bacterium]